ncbi:MAG: hypothetical protein ACRCWI_01900 [Brevinema sp.]
MNLYKLLRYCCFLFLVLVSILFFFPRNVVPYLSSFYQKLEEIYDNIPNMWATEKSEPVELMVQRQQEALLINPKNLINNFLNDLSTDYALESAIDRDFNDLEYLVDTYLKHDKFFEDIVLYQNGMVIYKYNQVVSPQALVLIDSYKTRQGEILIELAFNTDLLQNQLDRSGQKIYLSYRSRIFSPLNAPSAQEFIDRYKNHPDGKFTLTRQNFLYKKTIDEGLKTPLILFFIHQKNFGMGSILQFLFLLLFPLFWIVLIIVDRIIYHKLVLGKQKKEYNKFLHQPNDDKEDNLEWLDRFVSGVERSQKDIEEKK